MAETVKMSYNAALFRVRCELTRAMCLAADAPPGDLVNRARAKLEAVKASGDIDFFAVYESRLAEVWAALRAATDEPDDRRVQMTLAAGAPALAGIKVDKPTQDKAIASLTIEAAVDEAQLWRWEWFKLLTMRRLRELGVREQPSNAQLYSAFTRARAGENITAVPLGGAPAGGAPAGAKAFSVIANKQRMEIGVVVRNVKELRNKASHDAMLLLISQAVKQVSGEGVEYRVLKKDFLAALQSATFGPEGLGVDLPLVLLAAVGQARGVKSAEGAKVTFEISRDRMEAVIGGFKMEYYDDAADPVTVDWVQTQLGRSSITAAMTDDLVKGLSELIRRKENLNGVVAARGTAGTGGRVPFLYHSYKDAAERAAANLDVDALDIREMQQRVTVKAGKLVAEIRYETPPAAGRSVFGEEVPPPPNDELVVLVGDGIQQRGVGRYYATCDGIPLIEAEAISLSKVLVHEGDVNLRSGNIRFDGPVEIKGSIDSGAYVETSGDLVVHGSIRGGVVRCQGSITAKSGITTGISGRVQARNDIVADFIENSNIICGGNLSVVKALLNCQVYVGGTIKMTGKGGVAAGGRIFCRAELIADNLGFRHGAVTVLNVGVDWRVARSVDVKRARLEKLAKRSVDDRQALRELVQKSKAQLTPRHKELKEELQERLVRLRTLTERLEVALAKANALMTYSPNARVQVRDQLAANMSLTISGQPVAVVNELASVAILPKRRRGSYIVPLEEIDAEEKEAKAAAAAAGASGSRRAG